MTQYQANAVAVRENMARLRALRLANKDRANQAVPDQAAPRRRTENGAEPLLRPIQCAANTQTIRPRVAR
jgi:hypothetical protein